MADNYLPLNSTELEQLLKILWGNRVNPEIFRRWSQGFVFSDHEPSALVQFDGGPCSIIASVEAFLLKNLLFICPPKSNWRQLTSSEQNTLLCSSLCDILQQVSDDNSFNLVLVTPDFCNPDSPNDEVEKIEKFHKELKIRHFSDLTSLQAELISNLQAFCGGYGCILFLYSLLLTKGLEKVKEEIGDNDESLVDSVHGHGTQSLINLLITGKAVSYVWDNIKEVSGLNLLGISSKSQVGFLTLLEHLRYCEVGWFLKNPLHPIWLLGSETHLTVLFSEDKSLVGEEGPEAVARRVFNQFDKEGRGFINSESLMDIMKALDLFADPDYVKIMLEKLDHEQLGIVTLNDFLEEFYPRKNSDHTCHKFTVYHYNGLQRSCTNNEVSYYEAVCSIKDLPELQMISDFSPIKTCLLTKWPTIEIMWKNNIIPSLN